MKEFALTCREHLLCAVLDSLPVGVSSPRADGKSVFPAPRLTDAKAASEAFPAGGGGGARARVEICCRSYWSLNFWKHVSVVPICQPPASQCQGPGCVTCVTCGTFLYRWWFSYGCAPSSQPDFKLSKGRHELPISTGSALCS